MLDFNAYTKIIEYITQLNFTRYFRSCVFDEIYQIGASNVVLILSLDGVNDAQLVVFELLSGLYS
jgi:hypothetical protein